MDKNIRDLVEDIYSVLDTDNDHKVNEDNLEVFAQSLKDIVRRQLRINPKGPTLRFSSLGKQDRQLWYEEQDTPKEKLPSPTILKFLYGDITEALLLLLCKEAGHSVEREQETVSCLGVEGHIDAIIGGVVVDCKSASPYGYKKFENQTLLDDDPFGYIQQISGYSELLTPGIGPAFLAFDKVSGDICLSPVSISVSQAHHPEPRINHLREVLASDTPPPRCYSDVEDGKSGNRKLGVGCSYCSYKKTCYPELRGFAYSNGPKFLTVVVKTPDVPEFVV